MLEHWIFLRELSSILPRDVYNARTLDIIQEIENKVFEITYDTPVPYGTTVSII